MKIFACVATAVLFAGGPLVAGMDEDKAIDWIKNPKFGLARAKLEKKAAMLFFTADW
ncbi:MAG: hypothetical protein HY716_04245 [Planctomycetes bacterium]|nr:hypothetical protein [Planctomycetota bacterium]